MTPEQFLDRLLPDVPGGFYNAHHLNHMEPNKIKAFGGRAYKSRAEVLRYARWANSKQWSAYFACSTMLRAEVKNVSNGRGETEYRAIRNAVNAAGMKSLWMDVDLKDNHSLPQILQQMKEFSVATHIPPPSIAVSTGNGVHFYWATKETMEPTTWRVLAESLKQAALNHGIMFDSGCTTDAARVLRVPGTFNWKDPSDPKPVIVLGARPEDYDLKTLQDALTPYYQPIQPGPMMPDGFGDMTAGLSSGEAKPVPFADVLPECEVLRDTITTGGRNDLEPAWYRAVMTATYAEEGRSWAHALSAGHPDYTREATDAKFEQALRAREQNDLGWPRCRNFAADKRDICQRCKHFGKDRSPLNFRHTVETAKPPEQQVPQPADDLPSPYVRHPTNGTIFVPMQQKGADEDDPGSITNVPVLDYPLYNAELILVDDKPHLRFVAHVPKAGFAKPTVVNLPLDKLADKRACCTALTAASIMIGAAYQDRIREFLVSWVKQLQLSTTMTVREAYGWVTQDNGDIEGFSYAKHCATPKGPLPVTEPAPSLKAGYSPRGTLENWKLAAHALTDQKRPQIDIILASAFAAPLVKFASNCPGLVISAVSSQSGTGKTSGMKVAQAVWGNPQTEMNALDDTSASVANKIGSLRSLPLFWDELRGNEDTLRFSQLIFQVTQGKEKSRMSANLDRRPVGTWETMLIAAANASVLERVADASPEGPAGVYRVLEIEVPQIASSQKKGFVQFGAVIDKVGSNYGQAGAVYADYLGANAEAVRERVLQTAEKIRSLLDGIAEERFWVFSVAALLVGAQISVELGLTQIDVAAMGKHLCKEVIPRLRASVRAEHGNSGDTNETSASITALGEFVIDCHQKSTYLVTDQMPKPGPKTADVQIMTPAPGVPSRMVRPDAHFITTRNELRVSQHALRKFLQERKMFRRGFMAALTEELGAKTMNSKLGVGTPYVTPALEKIIVIDMNHDELKDILQ